MRRILIAGCLSLCAGLAHAEAAVPDAAFATGWLDNAYLGRYRSVVAASERLDASVTALCAGPDARRLDAARKDWMTAALAWRTMDGAALGPMVLERTGRRADFRPTRTAEIEARIAAGDGVDPLNVAARGLPAAEYLLWGDRAPQAQLARLKTPARCAYLAGTTTQLVADLRAVDWPLYRGQLNGAEAYFRRQMLPEAVGLMLAGLEGTIRLLPRVADAERDAYAQWRSDSTRAALGAQLDGFATGYFGADGKGGLAALVREQGHDEVNDTVARALAASRAAWRKLPQRLDGGSAAPARKAFTNAVAALKRSVEGDVADALDLSLGFNDSDGD
ncbi:imelysin family protein [Jeongeupia sp. USM3]|uniref:imelysin family protein n=1 Tax=Jeongeupia sp. USM3 TaxID=1906741 RepID=UPI00089DE305|nr:imelysin family protein [Jeongeupia sp. USM3]AOY00718.1 hypothetical protein BJP62_09885 [Jeongeupia sp. USM3]